jgi:cell division protein FtsB
MVKKSLLIWNIVITVVALALIFGACTSDSRGTWLVNQYTAQSVTIQQLQSDINTLKSTNSQLTAQIQAQDANLQNQINQIIAIINAR